MNEIERAIMMLESEKESNFIRQRNESYILAIQALREKAERENPQPLTIEQLKKRDGKPVYCVGTINKSLGVRNRYLDGWGIVNVGSRLIAGHHFENWAFMNYGVDYIAYDHEPKEVSNETD